MTGAAYSEQGVLPEFEPTGTGQEDASSGTYSLRRLHYFNDADLFPQSTEALQTPASRSQDDDFGAEQKMLIRHLRMVANIARQYAYRGVDGVELIRAGNLGLIHAMEHFQLGRTEHFSGYAEMCVRQHIERLIADQRKYPEAAQAVPQYAVPADHHAATGAGAPAQQGIYVVRAFIENRINELRRPRHVEFSPEFSGLYD